MTMKTTAIPALGLPLLAAVLLAGAAPAQTSDLPDPGRLPDHPLYFMTSASESIGTFFTFGDANKAGRALELSEKRLAEARALADQGKPEEAQKAADRYQVQLDRALSKAEEARAKGEDTDEVLTNLSEATSRHQAILAEVHQKVPEQARPGIERAIEASKRGHAQAREARSSARGRPDAPGRPESAGRPGSRGQGPPDARDTDRPGRGERGGPPDSVETGRRGDADRGPPRDRGRPDSVKAGRPDTAGGA